MRSDTPRPEGRLAGVPSVPADWALWAGAGARRSAGFERILGFAAPAFPMAQDAVDDARVRNQGNDAHAGAARAKQRIDFEDFSNQAGPRAAGLPGGVRIVLPGACVSRSRGVAGIGGRNRRSGAVGVGAVPALAMTSGIRDVRGYVLSCCKLRWVNELDRY